MPTQIMCDNLAMSSVHA